jgi:hypothetical protein
MTATLTVWHNIATDAEGRLLGMLDGYQPGHPLVPVARRELPITLTSDGQPHDPQVHTWLEEIWRLLNIGDDPSFGTPDPWAVQYRSRRNRSLSTGDVAQLTATETPDPHDGVDSADKPADLWFAVAHVGWTPIVPPSRLAIGVNRHGTTSLPPEP